MDGFSAEQSFQSSDLTDRNQIEVDYQSQEQVQIIPIDMSLQNQNIQPQKSKTRKEAWVNSSKHRRVTSSVSSSSQGYLMKSSRMEDARPSVMPEPVQAAIQLKDSFVTEVQQSSDLKPYEKSINKEEEKSDEEQSDSASRNSILIKPRASYHPELALRADQDSSVSLSIGDEDFNSRKEKNPFSNI